MREAHCLGNAPSTNTGFAVVRSLQNLMGNAGEWHHPVENPHLGANPRHSIDGTTGLILPQRETAVAMDSVHSLRAVGAHPSHDDPHSNGTECGGDGLHHDVNGGSV